MTTEEEEINDAVKKMDEYEDKEAAKRKKEAEEGKEENENDLIICPKCKHIVGEQDFEDDKLSEMGSFSIETKITCTKCGYIGMPIEISKKEYGQLKESEKRPA
ncbi:MAG: hypothetical protein ABII22_01995 [Candidatus Micrarchaeota archaeon]